MSPRPSASDAVDVLRQRFRGFMPSAPDDPADDGPIVADPDGALALHALREGRASELEDNLAVDEAAARSPVEHFVQGDPGRRVLSNQSAAMSAAVGRRRLERLGADMAADPNTGEAEQARVRGTQDALDKAMLTQRPELDDAAKAGATRNAFGAFLKSRGVKMGEYEAAGSPAALEAAKTPYYAKGSDVAQNVLEADSRRDVQRAEAQKGALFGDLGHGTPTAPTAKLTAQEQQLVDAAKTAESLAPELLSLLERDHPGIEADPSGFTSPTDMLGAKIGGGLYKMGHMSTENEARINMLSGFLEASLPRMLAGGRINQQQYEDLKLHVPQVGLSAGANYERTKYIAERLLPSVLRGVEAGHGMAPGATTARPAAPTNNNRRDPNRGM